MKSESINELIIKIDQLISDFTQDPVDFSISNGNVALCIIDEDANVYGKIWGSDKIKGRQSYKVAWTKASQVWITGIRTGEFEKKVFNNEISEKTFGLMKPDFIGWDGGQPLILKDDTKISIGFSGFRGISDLEIVNKAVSSI